MTTTTATTATTARAIHLVDIENMLGTPFFTVEDAAKFREFYTSQDIYSPGDLVVIATSSTQGLINAGRAWSGARLKFTLGQNGADLALIDVLREEGISSRFARVVIASGDGIFGTEVELLVSAHVDVHVVGRIDHVHHCYATNQACIHLFSVDDLALAA